MLGQHQGAIAEGSPSNCSNHTSYFTTPQSLSFGTGRTAKSVSLGSSYAGCAVLDNSSVVCWGANSSGQLGYGDTVLRRSMPTTSISFGSSTPATVLVGFYTTCALLTTGQVTCWGDNAYGELGLGNTTNFYAPQPTTPINLGTGRTATRIINRNDIVCALLDDQSVKCWGTSSVNGELGLGDSTNRGDTLTDTPNTYGPIQF